MVRERRDAKVDEVNRRLYARKRCTVAARSFFSPFFTELYRHTSGFFVHFSAEVLNLAEVVLVAALVVGASVVAGVVNGVVALEVVVETPLLSFGPVVTVIVCGYFFEQNFWASGK